MKISDKKISKILRESLMNEVKQEFNHFQKLAQKIDAGINGDPDKFYYIEIKQRFKDNRGIAKTGNYDGFGNYIASFKVHSGQELLNLEPQIKQLCNQNNARAYITMNPRSESAIHNHLSSPRFQAAMRKRNPLANPEDVLAGQAKSPYDENGNLVMNQQQMVQQFGSDRSKFAFDVDIKDPRAWELCKIVLDHFNIDIDEIEDTPSGGKHIMCNNAFDPNLKKAIELLRVFDHSIKFNRDNNGNLVTDRHGNPKYTVNNMFADRGMNQTVHANFDPKRTLYSNVDTAGY